MDFVITVCDQAAGEVCPVWHAQPAVTLMRRIEWMLSLPTDKLQRLTVQREMRETRAQK